MSKPEAAAAVGRPADVAGHKSMQWDKATTQKVEAYLTVLREATWEYHQQFGDFPADPQLGSPEFVAVKEVASKLWRVGMLLQQ